MAENLNPAASHHHLPAFVTAPGQTDLLFLAMGVLVLFAIIGVGVLYFRLHALPEQIAHRGQKMQLQIVAVLGLLALFTHNHGFWIAGLLLALVPLPDFMTPWSSMALSLKRLAAGAAPSSSIPEQDQPSASKPPAAAEALQETSTPRPAGQSKESQES